MVVPIIEVPVPHPAPVIIVAVPPLFSNSIHPDPVALISKPFIRLAVGEVSVGFVASTGFHVPVGVEFLRSFPVVPSKSAGAQSVEEAGHTTSPVHHHVAVRSFPTTASQDHTHNPTISPLLSL